MKLLYKIKPIYFWLSAGILLLIFFNLPINYTYKIKTPGKILPSKEWILTKGTDGQLITLLIDNINGFSSNYSVSQFNRGDAVQFSINPKISSGVPININDTIATIYSNEFQRQFIELQGDLQIAKASLNLNLTGEKKEIIAEEVERLEYMKKQSEDQKKIYNRVKSLYEQKLASQEEYDLAKGTSDLNDINIAIAEAHLATVSTGAKKEMTDYLAIQIQAIEKELQTMQQKFTDYIITSRIAGTATRISASGDTLLTISDNNEYIMILPIKWEERRYLKLNDKVVIKSPALLKNFTGKIFEIGKTVKALNGSQVFLATAKMESSPEEFSPNLIVQCSLECDKISAFEYLKRIIFSSF